jgi:transposase InsO family protein
LRADQRGILDSGAGGNAPQLAVPDPRGFHSNNGSEYINRHVAAIAREIAIEIQQVHVILRFDCAQCVDTANRGGMTRLA